MTLRIALASIHPRPMSGQIEQLVGLAQALQTAGHQVSIVSPFPSEQLLGSGRAHLGVNPPRLFADQPARISSVLVRLARLAPQVDLIQLDLPTPAFSVLGDVLQAIVRVPVVVGYEAHLVGARDLIKSNHLWRAPAFFLPRLLINNRILARLSAFGASYYIVSTAFQKRELVGIGVRAEKITVVSPMLPSDKLESTKRIPREAYPPGRLVTYIGHYTHVKGVDLLVDAFKSLALRHADLNLVLAWSGIGSNRSVQQLTSEPALRGRIIQLGQVCVPELLAASAVVVLPYRLTVGQAAFPAVLAEAMTAGVPIVTTDLPVLRELTGDGATALLVPPEDPLGLARAIECVLTDQSVANVIRRAQSDWAQKSATHLLVQDYVRVYEQATAASKAR